MFRSSAFSIFRAVGVIVSMALAAVAQEEGGQGQGRIRITSLTTFPVTAIGQQHKNFGEALALILEKEGFRKLSIADRPFRPEDNEDEADFDSIASSFGSFIEKNPIQTEFALYCEFQGTPTEGITAVRGVVVDKTGTVVWKDVQTPKDADFQRIKPDGPMTCCVLMGERIRPMLVMASADELAEEGELARLWRRQSGIPEKTEFAAMKVRQGEMKKASGKATVVVYPVRVGNQVDREGANHLAGLLNQLKLCQAEVADEPQWFEVKPNSNEQRLLWDMAKAFQSHVRTQEPTADYALYADYYILSSRSGKVGAVHFAVCDRKGDFVIVDFQNDHHRDFQAISPKSLKDCNRLAARRLEGYLK